MGSAEQACRAVPGRGMIWSTPIPNPRGPTKLGRIPTFRLQNPIKLGPLTVVPARNLIRKLLFQRELWMQQTYGVFEGGGVCGTSLVGAVRAVEEAGIQFRAVAGTSAGESSPADRSWMLRPRPPWAHVGTWITALSKTPSVVFQLSDESLPGRHLGYTKVTFSIAGSRRSCPSR